MSAENDFSQVRNIEWQQVASTCKMALKEMKIHLTIYRQTVCLPGKNNNKKL